MRGPAGFCYFLPSFHVHASCPCVRCLHPVPLRKDGFWAPAAVVDVLPDMACAAVDLKIDAQGALFVPFHQSSGGETRWRLMKIPAWGEAFAFIWG